MAFSSQFLDELKARVPVGDLVGRKVRLVRKGKESQGLCPFHKEKTPSFHVYDDHYHCFGCNAHGSAIDFLMETEGLSFPDAVRQLAAMAGMEVPEDTPEDRERERVRQTLHEVVLAATVYFERMLRMPEGAGALAYLHGRGLDDDIIRRFRLGFAPEGRDSLRAALLRDGVNEDQMVEAGLLKRPDDGRPPFGYFRGRAIFPITDRRGAPIAFGGRTLGDGEPKYLNSPETPLFQKGQVLFGLAQAMAPARKAGRLVVVEGYMDVISLHQRGLENVVAPLGTALTEGQLAELWRLVPEPVLCFDGDAAGQRAASRAAERALPLLHAGMRLGFAMLPTGEDPDSLVRRDGPDALRRLLDAAWPLSEMLWRMESGASHPATPEDKAALHKRLKTQASRITDPDLRRAFLEGMANRLWPERKPGWTGGARGGGNRRWSRDAPPPPLFTARTAPPAASVDASRLWESILLATLLGHPELYDVVGERLAGLRFAASELDNLRQEVLKTLAAGRDLDSNGLKHQLRQDGHAPALESVTSSRVFGHAYFARSGESLDDARDGWEETYERYIRMNLRADVEEATVRLARDTSVRALDSLRTLKDEELGQSEDDLMAHRNR